MKYDKLTKYFENDTTLTEILNELKDTFDIIDDYTQQFMSDIMQTSDELRVAKTKLTGITAYLNPIYSKALSLKKQREYRYYVKKKVDCETNNIKFTDSSTTTEAKDAVNMYRGVRDLIFGYVKAAESLIYD